MAKILIEVPFHQNRQVKALGALWDKQVRSMFIPDGVPILPFKPWLKPEVLKSLLSCEPAAVNTDAAGESVTTGPSPAMARAPDIAVITGSMAPSAVIATLPVSAPATGGIEVVGPSMEVAANPNTGITLSRLLQGVGEAVAAAYKNGIWTAVDVISATVRNGHVYLELAERDKAGTVVAKASGMIWANTARKIVPAFESATGAQLAGGIKILVRARPVFKPQFGFSVEIDDIDPDYTLGDLESRKREIRLRLVNEGLFGNQKKLEAPWDYNHVLVVAPDGAAGLGDFQAESNRLAKHGLCEFVYVHSRFQGEGAAAEITLALSTSLKNWKRTRGNWPDAVVIIRGGGAANDLAWLNDYELSSLVCKIPTPVFTGIGHERDNTLLDEICHTRFDTPSKVIAGIEQMIVRRAREARENFEHITHTASLAVQKAKSAVQRLDADNRANAMRQIEMARVRVAELYEDVQEAKDKNIQAGRDLAKARLDFILERGVSHTLRVRVQVNAHFDSMSQGAAAVINSAKGRIKGLIREILVQGPEKTLVRGFCIARDDAGRPLTRASSIGATASFSLQFFDDSIDVRIEPNRVHDAPVTDTAATTPSPV